MNKVAAVDIAIFGGGIAGLWLLHRLRQAGLTAVLFESGALGAGQTLKSQGIIHGGMKYALQGVLTAESQSMADLPALWQKCLDGTGEIDLQAVKVLSDKQYLWAPNKFTSTVAGMAATKTLSSKVQAISREQFPPVFQHPSFKGHMFALDEMVLDVPSLVKALAKANQDALYKIEPLCDQEIKLDEHGNMVSATVYLAGQALEVRAQQFVFTAGSGNEVIIKKLQKNDLAMQRRPLHMTMVKTGLDYDVYAHCLSLSVRPRVTITTHHLQSGEAVWYLGGAIAEDGVNRNTAAQNKAAHDELCSLFPWLDFSKATYASFMIDRAEPLQSNGLKPETALARTVGNMTVAWPTKLALAPRLAEELMRQFKHIKSEWHDVKELRAWAMPTVGRPIWEDGVYLAVES